MCVSVETGTCPICVHGPTSLPQRARIHDFQSKRISDISTFIFTAKSKRKVQAFEVSTLEEHGSMARQGGGGDAGDGGWSCPWDMDQRSPPAPGHTPGAATVPGTLRRRGLEIQGQGRMCQESAALLHPPAAWPPTFGSSPVKWIKRDQE